MKKEIPIVSKPLFHSIMLSILQRTFNFPLSCLVLQVLTLVIGMLAGSQCQFKFGLAMLEIDLERHQGKALLPGLAEQLHDLSLMHQQLARTQRIVIEDISLFIGTDMHILHKNLAIPDDCIAVLEIGPARPQGLYFRPLQSQTGLIGLMDKEIMTCLAILASNLHANVFLSQMVSPFPFDRNL